jgi:elongation factor P
MAVAEIGISSPKTAISILPTSSAACGPPGMMTRKSPPGWLPRRPDFPHSGGIRQHRRNSGLASPHPAAYPGPTKTMASTPIINLRKGHAVRHNNEVCLVTDHELKTPPRMASYVQMSIRSVATKKVFNLRMTSNDSIEGVVLERTPHEYSYKDSSGYHFLDPNTYEDAVVYEDLIENVKNYLIEGQLYNLLIADGIVVAVDLPLTMTMTVTESSEGVKGDSANNVYKPATMETGLVVQVPLFINVGEKINVKTEDNSYLGRA